MKIKTLIILIIVIITIFVIYIFNIDKKVYYANITNENNQYNKMIKNELKNKKELEKYTNILKKDYRVTDLIRDINENIIVNKESQTIQNVLIKADILTLKIGSDELEYKTNLEDINELFDYVDELIRDLDQLFKLIRIYDKEKIYYIGFYNKNADYKDEIYKYLNLRIKDLCSDYDINFIDIGDLNNVQENEKIKEKILNN